jgi:eukaryotic-like serine/threonine-protein kinase
VKTGWRARKASRRGSLPAREHARARSFFLERSTPFGKYVLLERINVGGMAEVFKAKTVGVEGFEKVVAIKRILPAVAADQEFIGMFIDEAKITAALSHANLAQTFDLGRVDDTYYIAMEYVPGKDLRAIFERLKRRGEKLPLRLAAHAMACVCDGLDYAHNKRDAKGEDLHIVHRDVSPQNVIVGFEGEVKLIDFGIAKAANKMTRTQTGILKGKFGYMSPEQVRGMPLDRRSDIFAAGVVLHELCTGERLFVGASDFNVLEKVEQAKVTKPSQLEPGIPAQLERIILRALTREPADRYQQAGELAADLRLFLAEHAGQGHPRDELARFMRTTFPDESAREPATHGETKASQTEPAPAGITAAGAVDASAKTDPARRPPRGTAALVAIRTGVAIGAVLALWAAVAAAHAKRAGTSAPATSSRAAAPVPADAAAQGTAAEEQSTAPDAPALGFLSLSSRPPAEVVIDGIEIGRSTPLPSWPLKAGSHRITLLAGPRSKELRVEIAAGQTLSEIVDLRGR